jgi:hypothetical protein
MKTALFHNFTSEPFTFYWDGKPHTTKPGEKLYMPEYLARHAAKHLTNQELLKKGMENYTSPKRQEDVPEFMKLFNKACIIAKDAQENDEVGSALEVMNPGRKEVVVPPELAGKKPQIINSPDTDEDDEEFEDPKK